MGTSSTVVVTISNVGNGELNVSSIGLETDFAVTSAPAASIVVQPNETIDAEVTYAPTVVGYNSGVLRITSNDPNEPVVDVQLSAVGVETADPPSEQIAKILAFFDTSVDNGRLIGNGQGDLAKRRLKALRNMIVAVGNLIEDELF
ncbi:MAG: Ig-like domain-containing protein, partial [Planctomycetota bacterium]